jgi:DNA-binding response OmpR family regulator
MDPTRSILVVEEDDTARDFLTENLTADGFHVDGAADQPDALEKLRRRPDLVVCDVNGDTLALLDAVRGANGLAAKIDPTTPLIVLTARTDALMRVRYFDRGSDDVVEKPYSYAELLARIRAVLRRTYEHTPGRVVRVGELVIDTVARDVRVDGQAVQLAAREYALLVHLAGDPTKVFTKRELLRDVWGFRGRGHTRTLESHALRLRSKLRAAGQGPWVQTVWGVGYCLVRDSAVHNDAA